MEIRVLARVTISIDVLEQLWITVHIEHHYLWQRLKIKR